MTAQNQSQGPTPNSPTQTPRSDSLDASSDQRGLAMPADTSPAAHPPQVLSPPTFGREMLQLVLIPAAIVVVCIGLALLFGWLAGAKDTIDNHLLKLRQSGGAGHLPFGLQDPRYKDRGLAAHTIATMIRSGQVSDPAEQQHLSAALTDILQHNVADHEVLLQAYLLIAVGCLGQQDALPVLFQGLQSPHAQVRHGAILALLSWPDVSAARSEAVPALQQRLADTDPAVRATAAAALGKLASPGDAQVIAALRQAMGPVDLALRESRWNAAVALARLGDADGSRFVATVLLDRAALAQLPAAETGPDTQKTMPPGTVDRVMLATLKAADTMTDPAIWDKITQIADHDPSLPVRQEAYRLLQAPRPAPAGPPAQ